MKKMLLWVVCLGCLLVASSAFAFDLTILHVNDSHSYLAATGDRLVVDGKKTYVDLGGWPRLTTAVKHARRDSSASLLLHAGDAVQGDLYFMKYDGRPEMEFLNRLKFDAYVLGNHEFDKGAKFLANFLEYVGIPVLGANVDAAGMPRLADHLKPYVVRCFGQDRVGVIGLVTSDTQYISSPGKGVDFKDVAETARRYVKELQDLGVDKIVLLTHVGLEADKELAASIPGVDIIVGGHSHSLLANPEEMHALGKGVDDDYPVVVKGPDGNDVYVVQAWKWGRVLGRLDVTFDTDGQVVSAIGKPVMLVADGFQRKDKSRKRVELTGEVRQAVVDALTRSKVTAVMAEDAPAAAFLEPYTKGVQAMRKDVIGKAPKTLWHIRAPGVNKDGVKLQQGSMIAPLVAQSMLDKIATTGDPADIALVNAGGVRDNLKAGKISVGEIYTLLPFNNTLFLLEVTGAQLKAALEYGVNRSGGAFPYVAGARYTANMKREKGDRIESVELQGRDGKWHALDPTKSYRVVTNAYMAGGGDGYTMLKEIADRYDTGFVDSEAFIEFVKKTKVLKPPKRTGITYIPAYK
ncbi:5'-nucleotidase C-terminal domain-containing protein [Pseudodesulfovibrio sp. zrk46]|uniref:bifunctional metallophosphatase/5'-nucleotidase n=1 Tax=Pseudodesulfovibrio sp. zrk46 TaxID=2725288 RepID=UPI00144A2315|nr:5'-nucleotidase C-terminal domain-containing protein [Pseudodesulfovibrio sp. zrk46]QJB55358.1 bifunctional NAD pyrophosphatase/5'-nucleotidase [Pseudodesulfovibrio sp. zrk46]